MRKAGNFIKSIVPFLIAILLQLVATVPVCLIWILIHTGENGGSLDGAINILTNLSTNTELNQLINITYGVLALIVFVTWYRKVFVHPFRHKKREHGADVYPSGFSFHNVLALIFLAVSLQYVTTFVVDVISRLQPAWLESYQSLMRTAGYGDASLMLMIYSVILAPIVEEIIFRGLIFRYARHALPFWLANIWQALLFGLLHMNILQGIYAFTLGLVLGFLCHRGRGLRYSILLHILFNFIGVFYSGLIELTTAFGYELFIGIGFVLTAFALWLFYTDFSR